MSVHRLYRSKGATGLTFCGEFVLGYMMVTALTNDISKITCPECLRRTVFCLGPAVYSRDPNIEPEQVRRPHGYDWPEKLTRFGQTVFKQTGEYEVSSVAVYDFCKDSLNPVRLFASKQLLVTED